MSDTTHNGDLAEQIVIVELLKLGYKVLRPITNADQYDLVIDISGIFKRIQVKKSYFHKTDNVYMGKLYGSHSGRYNKNEVDFIIYYVEDMNLFYIIPVDILVNKSDIIHFAPHRKSKLKYEIYKNNWSILNTHS